MNFSQLSASELARIDAICLEFESRLRRGETVAIEPIVAKHGGRHAKILRDELESIRRELVRSQVDETIGPGEELPERTGLVSTEPNATPRPVPTHPTRSDAREGPLAVGDWVGPYRIDSLLGRGGMGVVYGATDSRLSRRVAIKTLAGPQARRADLVARFEREARAVAAISHPGIVELFDIGILPGADVPYAVMEFLDGETLGKYFERGSMTVEQVHGLATNLAQALAAAHRAGVVHRDLKPHNVMVLPANEALIVKVFDFGLSRRPAEWTGERSAGGKNEKANERTGEGVILGTPGYMAPEQVLGTTASPASDVFALGCLLHEAFYRRRAFDGETAAARMAAVLTDQPKSPRHRRDNHPKLAALIDACLEKDLRRRPESAAVVARRLDEIPANPTDKPTPLTSRRAALAASAALLTVATATWAGRRWLAANNRTFPQISSLAVLSFTFADERPSAGDVSMPPLGRKPMTEGEMLAAAVVHELSKLPDFVVPPFRPATAATRDDFVQLGGRLGVDALVSATIYPVDRSSDSYWNIDWQLVAASSGDYLTGGRLQTDAVNNLLGQTRVAAEIARRIDRKLFMTVDEPIPPDPTSFSCLVKGETGTDPDSIEGLRFALDCFEHAATIDREYPEPIGGAALASMLLSAQVSASEAAQLTKSAREKIDLALRLDPQLRDARLADAMFDWQKVVRPMQAAVKFADLLRDHPNAWQVHHQAGLFHLFRGEDEAAIESLRIATLLNPASVVLKVDAVRADWFAGNASAAIKAADSIRSRFPNSPPATGLLIDLYENQDAWSEAAALLGRPGPVTRQDYLRVRETRLESMPYAPSGPQCNRAIWLGRAGAKLTTQTIDRLIDPLPPLMPLWLVRHPALAGFADERAVRSILGKRV